MMPQNGSSRDSASIREIAAQINAVLNLFWQGDETPEVRAQLADVWISDFIEFDAEVVADACREWRHGQTRRPSIAELRAICREGQDTANWKRQRALPPPEGEAPAWFTADMQRDWSWPEYDGDSRSPWQRRSDAIARQQAKRLSPEEMQRGGRALCNQWARLQGYADFAAAERAGHTHTDVVAWVIANANPKRMPLAPGEPVPAAERERIRRHSLLEEAA